MQIYIYLMMKRLKVATVPWVYSLGSSNNYPISHPYVYIQHYYEDIARRDGQNTVYSSVYPALTRRCPHSDVLQPDPDCSHSTALTFIVIAPENSFGRLLSFISVGIVNNDIYLLSNVLHEDWSLV